MRMRLEMEAEENAGDNLCQIVSRLLLLSQQESGATFAPPNRSQCVMHKSISLSAPTRLLSREMRTQPEIKIAPGIRVRDDTSICDSRPPL